MAYIVKLNIEMAMSNLIIKVAHETGAFSLSFAPPDADILVTGIHVLEDSTENSRSASGAGGSRFQTNTLEVQVARQQFTTHDQDDIGESHPPS